MKCDVYNKVCFSPVCSAISGQEDCPNRLSLEVEQLKKELTQKDKAIDKAVDLFLLLGKCPKWFGKCENHECNDVSSPAEQRKQCWREYLTKG